MIPTKRIMPATAEIVLITTVRNSATIHMQKDRKNYYNNTYHYVYILIIPVELGDAMGVISGKVDNPEFSPE